MQQKLANLDGVLETLKKYLPDYLHQHEIDTNKNFVCLNPKHDDTDASMTIGQNANNAFCFGCGRPET